MRECKILLVDDDPEDHYIMKEAMALVNADSFIHFTTSGSQALELLAGCTGDQFPQLIVLDLNMPILNGTETLRILKNDERYRHIPVIIFSTSNNPVEKEKCLTLGAHAYLIKPNTHKQTIEMVKLFLEFCNTTPRNVTPMSSKEKT